MLSEKHTLFFITITCKGKEMALEEAEAHYLGWTNTFLTNCRVKAKRSNQDWYYVQVTEKQKRGHPHSHILTTFSPNDLYLGRKFSWKTKDGLPYRDAQYVFRSEWLRAAVLSAGLGEQYDVSIVDSAEGASRYVAKYMFKDSMFGTHWPKGWKRVRYSQNFPRLPERDTNAFILMSVSDWDKLAGLALFITTTSEAEKQECLHRLRGHDILVS